MEGSNQVTVIFEDVLRDLIVTANLTDRRVFLMRAPQAPAAQAVTPYMVITPTGPSPEHTHGGPVGLLTRHYQVAIFDPSQYLALAIADALRTHLDGYKGTFGGVEFGAIFFRLQSNAYEPDTKLWAVITEFRMRFRMSDAITTTKAVPKAVRTAVRSQS